MIKTYTLEQSKEWDRLVQSFENYDVFYLSGYSKALALTGEGDAQLIYYENDLDCAINVVFIRDVAKDERFKDKIPQKTFYDIITPYGYGGFWGKVTDEITLNKEWEDFCCSQGYVCEFVRFELLSDYQKFFQGHVESNTHNIIRNLTIPLDEMWMDFKAKVRKNVKKAHNLNLEIIIDPTGQYLDDFLKIYYDTMKRSEAEKSYYFPQEFYQTINMMKDNIVYFHVLYNNSIISTELVIYGSENCYSFLGGTDKGYFEVRPNDFLKMEIIKWAKSKGLKNFVLGGGYGQDDGIYQYKKGFSPNGVVDFCIGKKIFNMTVYKKLCAIRGVEPSDNSYFPAYRRK